MASNLTEIVTNLDILEAEINSSDVTHVQQKLETIETENLPELKRMVRHSIKKGKENYSSIEELKKHIYSLGSPITQPNFEMINTLMVVD